VRDQILLLVVGFLLTSVLGGALGYVFQARSWRHQRRASSFDTERAAATKVFEGLSSLMDRRLYRMRKLMWAIHQKPGDKNSIESAMSEYRAILYEWNDGINKQRALVQRYFGPGPAKHLETFIYEGFARLGEALEHEYRLVDDDTMPLRSSIGSELTTLSDRIYEMNVHMITLIQLGKVGLFALGNQWARDETA
jgi:hypothetical protein